jgi:hypothetical protein
VDVVDALAGVEALTEDVDAPCAGEFALERSECVVAIASCPWTDADLDRAEVDRSKPGEQAEQPFVGRTDPGPSRGWFWRWRGGGSL